MSATHRWMLCLAALLLLGGNQGCGGDGEEAAPAAVPETAPPAPTPRAEAPAPMAEPLVPVELPANFPSDIPVPPGAFVESVQATQDMGVVVSIVITGTPEEVGSLYADSLEGEGWSTSIRDMPDGRGIFADKSDRTAAVIIAEDERGSRVHIVVSELAR